jgi:hypothetical protein
MINTVKNTSKNSSGSGIDLIVTHRDTSGAEHQRTTVLKTGQPTPDFSHLGVLGNWRADATNISAALLQSPARVTLEVAWKRP